LCLLTVQLGGNMASQGWAWRQLEAAMTMCRVVGLRPTLEHYQVSTVTVHGFRSGGGGGTGVLAMACVDHYSGTSETCGPMISSTAGDGVPTVVTLTGSNLYPWNDSAFRWDFPYLFICSNFNCINGTIHVQGVFLSE